MNAQFTHEQAVNAVIVTQNFHKKTAEFINSHGLEPNSGSLGAIELQTFERTESILTAYSQGVTLIEVAADHLYALTRTLTEPMSSIAPWTLARAVLESSALSCWILTTKISAKSRVSRSFALRYEGFFQHLNYLRASGQFIEATKLNERIEEVEALALTMGFSKLRNAKGNRTGIGQVMPSITDIIRDTLGEEANYRLLSAMAHGHHWAFGPLSFKKIGATDIQRNPIMIMEKYMPVEAVLWLCSNVIIYFTQPIKLQSELYGWEMEQLNVFIHSAFNEMGIHPDSGLWHGQQEDAE